MSPFYADPAAPGGGTAESGFTLNVDSSSTLITGGTLDWIGRCSIKRRPSDSALVMVYYRSTGHGTNAGGLYIRFSNDNGATWTAENTALASDGGGAISGFPMNPTVSSGQDAGEGWLMIAPSGDLLIHMWRVDYTVSGGGTYQSRSEDGGLTWSTPAGPISWAGLTADQNLRTFATDDDFIVSGTLYCGARVYTNTTTTVGLGPSAVTFMSSADDGATWTRVSTLVSSNDLSGNGCQEVGLEYLGSNNVVALIRDNTHTNCYKKTSSDLGATWSTLTTMTSVMDIGARFRVYTGKRLRGEASPETDTSLVAVGFVHQVSGQSTQRRPCVWISLDSGATWSAPQYIDTSVEDAGYGDVFYDSGNTQYVVVNYHGTQSAADLKQYRLTITGL